MTEELMVEWQRHGWGRNQVFHLNW